MPALMTSCCWFRLLFWFTRWLNLSLMSYALFEKFLISPHMSWHKLKCWSRVVEVSFLLLRMWPKPGLRRTLPRLSNTICDEVRFECVML